MRTGPSSMDQLRAQLARELEIEEHLLSHEARFVGDLGLSSINAIVVVMALEEWFGLRISDEEAEGLLALSDVQAFLASRGIELENSAPERLMPRICQT
jgi:acyl carrier protein